MAHENGPFYLKLEEVHLNSNTVYLPLIILIRKPMINTITTTAIIATQNPASKIPIIASQLVSIITEEINRKIKVRRFLFIIVFV